MGCGIRGMRETWAAEIWSLDPGCCARSYRLLAEGFKVMDVGSEEAVASGRVPLGIGR